MKRYRKIFRSITSSLLLAWCAITPGMAATDDSQHVTDMKIDDSARIIVIYMDDEFAEREFNEKSVKAIYRRTTKQVHRDLPREYRKYDVRIMTKGTTLESLIDNRGKVETVTKPKRQRKHGGWWGDMAYDGKPWVTNVSRPVKPKSALAEKHIALWASHGRYYDVQRSEWRWQRPFMFGITEDLFSQTIVVPYLIPMLESAGANVFTPRERDWQSHEVVVDNDPSLPSYYETNSSGFWKDTDGKGFAIPAGLLVDSISPFTDGTVRQIASTKNENASCAVYQPQIPATGRYAVYVSYATVEKSIDDVLYSVYHKGQRTDFHVNQKMGGGTWVYLGTFEFDYGFNPGNSVVVSSFSHEKGIVTTDAVRFGGGMGNIERGGETSNMPRCVEGARYYAQWAGAPYSVYGGYHGADDYKDDINVRSLMTNWIGGGSPYMPDKEGKKVPIDLCLAVHTDAGYKQSADSLYGSLAICTTNFNDGKLDAGVSREKSRDFCQMILDQTKKDLTSAYGQWTYRDLWDKNYSETRLPGVPSAIFEALSHQNFADMKMAHDPNFKFTMARSLYKTILHYEAEAHGEKAIVQPLPPEAFYISLDDDGLATLVWTPQNDPEEPTAVPTSFNIYKAAGNMDYDNGTNVTRTQHNERLMKDVPYRFRITAVNDGGESFPTQELFVLWHDSNAPTVMIIDAFDRLAAPQVRNTETERGFDLDEDPGLSYGITAGWSGRQKVYDIATMGKEGPGTFAYCGHELAGTLIAGNSFDYATEHGMALATAGRYNIVSADRAALEQGSLDIAPFDALDIIMGNERYDGYSLKTYKTFTKQMQRVLTDYCNKSNGALLVSGSYIASDMQEESEKDFLSNVLHIGYEGQVTEVNDSINGLQQTILVTNKLNPDHYATVKSDILTPTNGAFIAMQYRSGHTAGVAYRGRTSTFAMGFPLECITDKQQKANVLRGIMMFLTTR